jgi:hypothetical protein
MQDWWFQTEGKELDQGHLLSNIVHPRMTTKQLLSLVEPGLKSNVTFARINAVVMSHGCDLAHKDLPRAIVVKAMSVEDALASGFAKEKLQEIRDGRRPLFSVLAGPGEPDNPEAAIILDHRWTLSLPLDYLEDIAGSMGIRPALCSPYIEHMSSAFGRCFSRVALPDEAPDFV